MTMVDAELGRLSDEMAALRGEVDSLRSRAAIHDLIIGYARACDVGNDPVRLRPMFTDDATWECKGFGRFVGGDECALGLKAVAGEKIWWSLHNMISPQITMDRSGEEASGFWYLWEAATLPDEHSGVATAHWIGATYHTRMRRVAGAWRFSMVELRLDMVSPFGRGWVDKRFPDGTESQPYFVRLRAGETRSFCQCGQSATMPACDGVHGCGATPPLSFTATEDGVEAICNCPFSKTRPLCDGGHLHLQYDWSLLGKVPPCKIER